MNKLYDVIKNEFDPFIQSELIEFGKQVATLDVDIIVLMARKAVGLFDILKTLGIDFKNKQIVSDRILDIHIEYFKGKRVALVDDTLIVGTTLQNALKQLSGKCKSVEVHVFCVDKDNWQPKLITPNSIRVKLSSANVMSFCVAEVRAFNLISRPYLVDFPLSKEFPINIQNIELLENSTEWEFFEVPSQTSDICNNKLYTLFPREKFYQDFLKTINLSNDAILGLSKIRLFVRAEESKNESTLYCKIVPIITLKALNVRDLDRLFDSFTNNLNPTQVNKRIVKKFLSTPVSKQRFIQYLLSYIFGREFIQYYKKITNYSESIQFDDSETILHFGAELAVEIKEIVESYQPSLFWNDIGIEPAEVPMQIQELHSEIVGSLDEQKPFYGSLVNDFFELFSELFRKKEKPERVRINQEVASGKSKKITSTRLNRGLAYSQIVSYLSEKYFINPTKRFHDVLSIALDISNDYGVSVPLTCQIDNTVLRLYRHGELGARISNDLIIKYLSSFMAENRRESLPHLLLQKLLVLFFRIGVGRKFLEETDDKDAWRVNWELMGAVMARNSTGFYPLQRTDWLTENLIANKILERHEEYIPISQKNVSVDIDQVDTGQSETGPVSGEEKMKHVFYTLARNIEGYDFTGTYRDSEALSLAELYGEMFGTFCRNKKNEKLKDAPLTTVDMILLASCTDDRDIAMALAAELKVFNDWYYYKLNNRSGTFLSIDALKTEESLLKEIDHLTNRLQKGYQAFHQAYLKYSNAYHLNKVPEIIDRVESYGSKTHRDKSREWKMIWNKLLPNRLSNRNSNVLEEQERVYQPLIKSAIVNLWEIGNWIILYEILLNYYLNKTFPQVDIHSKVTYKDLTNDLVSTKIITDKLKNESNPETEIAKLTKLGLLLRGRKIGMVYNKNTQKNEIEIITIDNANVEIASLRKLTDFNQGFLELEFDKPEFIRLIEQYLKIYLTDNETPVDYGKAFGTIIRELDRLVEVANEIRSKIETVYRNYGRHEDYAKYIRKNMIKFQ